MTSLCDLAIMVEFWTRKKEMRDEDENNIERTSGYEKSAVSLARLRLELTVMVILPAGSGHVPAVSGKVD
jgi:hypothetical protein